MCDQCGEVVYSKTRFYGHKHRHCKDASTGRWFHSLECGIALQEMDQFIMKHMKELHDTDLKEGEVCSYPSKHGNSISQLMQIPLGANLFLGRK